MNSGHIRGTGATILDGTGCVRVATNVWSVAHNALRAPQSPHKARIGDVIRGSSAIALPSAIGVNLSRKLRGRIHNRPRNGGRGRVSAGGPPLALSVIDRPA